MVDIDFLVAWEWEYDRPFVRALETRCCQRGLQFRSTTPRNLTGLRDALSVGRFRVGVFFDRGSDTNEAFHWLVEWARANVPRRLNAYEHTRRAWDKRFLHHALIEAGVHTPWTIALPSWETQPELGSPNLTPLGVPFSIKPAFGGGGEGVITDASSWEDVLAAREEWWDEPLILQEFVEPFEYWPWTPERTENRRGWFRVIYACGEVFPCWWDDRTHLFLGPVTPTERHNFGLEPLWTIPHVIARVSQVDLFSTEIARVPDGRFIVVDYLNDPIDLRRQSQAAEGVPDAVVDSTAEAIVSWVASPLRSAGPDR